MSHDDSVTRPARTIDRHIIPENTWPAHTWSNSKVQHRSVNIKPGLHPVDLLHRHRPEGSENVRQRRTHNGRFRLLQNTGPHNLQMYGHSVLNITNSPFFYPLPSERSQRLHNAPVWHVHVHFNMFYKYPRFIDSSLYFKLADFILQITLCWHGAFLTRFTSVMNHQEIHAT